MPPNISGRASYTPTSSASVELFVLSLCALDMLMDALPDNLWGKCFLEAEGYNIEHNVLLQDNKLTIFLATNGMISSSKKRNTLDIDSF